MNNKDFTLIMKEHKSDAPIYMLGESDWYTNEAYDDLRDQMLMLQQSYCLGAKLINKQMDKVKKELDEAKKLRHANAKWEFAVTHEAGVYQLIATCVNISGDDIKDEQLKPKKYTPFKIINDVVITIEYSGSCFRNFALTNGDVLSTEERMAFQAGVVLEKYQRLYSSK